MGNSKAPHDLAERYALRGVKVKRRPRSSVGVPYVASAVQRGLGERRREDLVGDQRAVLAQGLGDLAGSAAQPSAIRSVTSRPLVLRASWISRIASRASPPAQLRGHGPGPGRPSRPSGGHRPALARGLGDDHLVGGERHRLAVDGDGGRARSRRAAASGGSAPATALATVLEPLPKRWPSARKLALAVVSTSVAGSASAQATDDVELLGDLAPQLLGQLGPAGAPTSARHSGWRLRTWTPAGRTGPAPPAGGPAPSARPAVVDQRPSGLRPGGQVHRLRRSGHRGDQVLPDPLGDERHHRRHQQGEHLEALVQGCAARPGRRPRSGGGSGGRTSWTGRRRSRRAAVRRAGCRTPPAPR